MCSCLGDPSWGEPIADEVKDVVGRIAERDPTPERLPAVAVRGRHVWPVDLAAAYNVVEADENVFVRHVDRDLQIERTAPTLAMRDRALALEQARGPGDFFSRRHLERVPANKRSV
jgi:hypothetical protein